MQSLIRCIPLLHLTFYIHCCPGKNQENGHKKGGFLGPPFFFWFSFQLPHKKLNHGQK